MRSPLYLEAAGSPLDAPIAKTALPNIANPLSASTSVSDLRAPSVGSATARLSAKRFGLSVLFPLLPLAFGSCRSKADLRLNTN